MLLEIAEIEVRSGAEDEFAAAVRETGLANLAACEGVVSARFGRAVENPSKFTFNVVWTSVEAHEAARSLPTFQEFSKVFAGRTVGGSMNHFRMDDAVAGASA